ncbi:hypothetical protein PCANC_16269 [Puccinia coronata f. sp. avenae]|uniref:Uncharacterized protein n=1 Tax=Puccinia coronata f. sp. avenae TaxID=200324 RepID=A0A2N5TVM9_9BASI|nr:hypothetical protein PCASD_15972 [Puccinia coronata f. sp. avenae]PLW33761.1 hypothetical protein PCANC_16269 [Puccinia coronata f. sp. avenae]
MARALTAAPTARGEAGLHGGTIPKSGGRRQSYRRPPVALMTATSGIEVIATPVAYNTTPARLRGRCRPHRQP